MDTKGSPPRDFNALRSLITERRGRLPKRLTQVANFALEYPDDIAFGTAASIAASAQVQPSTLVRFAQNFGYEGFSDLQSVFRGRLMERTPSYEDRLHELALAGKGPSQNAALLNGFFSAGRQSLDTLSATIDVDAFSRAVDLLAKADTLFLIAKRRTFPISAYMAYAFGKMGVRHQLIASPNGIDQEWINMATPLDAAIAISFSPYAAESIAQARSMAARKVPVMAITDSAVSPLAECADVWLEVAEADHARFRSLSATMALSMALTVGIAEKRLLRS